MLCNPSPTPFDLQFNLFGIPVRIHPMFWLLTIVMGWNPEHPQVMIVWTVCVFVSILVHELGHALTAQAFGWPPEIVLYGMGGLAVFQADWRRTTWKMVLTLLAGPGAGFLLYAALKCAIFTADLCGYDFAEAPEMLLYAIMFLQYINLFWGLVNLLPVFPLDGGQITRELLLRYVPRRAIEYSLKSTMLVGGLVALGFFRLNQPFAAMLFAMMAVESYLALQGQQLY